MAKFFKYPKGKKIFKLKKVDGFMYVFECGHKVTDNVFVDMIQINPPSRQLKLNLF